MRHDTLYIRIIPMVLALVLVLTLMLPAVPAVSAAEYEGTCGRNLNWSFELGTLTITGTGAMEDYPTSGNVPWHDFREEIFRVELPEGLTRVGNLAFSGCENLTAVAIPGSVRQIGVRAFQNCTGLAILMLPEGLNRIEENAFEMCSSLRDLRLPNTLLEIQWQAFYRCYALRTVEIPSSVVEMGVGVFSYCYGLLKARIHAPLEVLPQWTFYGCANLVSIELPPETTGIGNYGLRGCDSLEVVYYGGEPGDAEELKKQISEEIGDFAENGTIQEDNPEEGETVEQETTDENGDTIREETTVTDTEESTITVTDKENVSDPEAEDPPTEISGTVVDEEGWEQVEDAIKDALKDSGSVEGEIYLGTDTQIPDSMVENLAGKDVVITVINPDGTKYTLDFNEIDKSVKAEGLDLSYQLKLLEDVKYEQLQGLVVYELRFRESSQVPVGAAIQLPIGNGRQIATLFQVGFGKPQQLQSTVVDQKGVAHYYLAAVDKKTTYLIAINVPTVGVQDSYIPKELEQEYGITEQIRNVDYVVTGRVSSWGLTSVQVTQVMIGIMLSAAAFVGLGMYALNKRKLRKGFIPGWDDAEDEE